MQFRKPVTASACLFGVGLLAAACSSSSSSSSTSSPAATAASSTSGSQASSQATSQASAPTSASGSANGSATATAQAAGATPTCTVSVLQVTLGTTVGSGNSQRTQTVVLTNKGSSACTMDGYPGVDLIGTVSGKQNYSWPLTRSAAKYSKVTLDSGRSAHFDLAYLPFAAGDGTEIAVSKIVLTPPNTTTQATLTWSQPVLLQDAATHPGTWISPVTAGA